LADPKAGGFDRDAAWDAYRASHNVDALATCWRAVLKEAYMAGWAARKQAQYQNIVEVLDRTRRPVPSIFPTDAELDPK
jgi:hypothetical protein